MDEEFEVEDSVEPEIVAIDAVSVEDIAIVEVAQEVVAGRWGRGNRRKARLREAGFDPAAVQHEVDKIFNQK